MLTLFSIQSKRLSFKFQCCLAKALPTRKMSNLLRLHHQNKPAKWHDVNVSTHTFSPDLWFDALLSLKRSICPCCTAPIPLTPKEFGECLAAILFPALADTRSGFKFHICSLCPPGLGPLKGSRHLTAFAEAIFFAPSSSSSLGTYSKNHALVPAHRDTPQTLKSNMPWACTSESPPNDISK